MWVLAVNENSNVSAVVVGSTATFSCYVNNAKKIIWTFGSKAEAEVYVNDKLVPKFAERYSVKHINGKAYLTIKNVQHCDAGSYGCNYVSNEELRKCEFLLITTGKHFIVTHAKEVVMAALRSRCGHYIFIL